MHPVLEFIRGIDPILLNSLTFLIGLIAGNRIAIVRDKRQEFNAAIAPLRARLLMDRKRPTTQDKRPTDVEIDLIERHLWPLARRNFRLRLRQYQECREEQRRGENSRETYYADPKAISASIDRLLTTIKPRQ